MLLFIQKCPMSYITELLAAHLTELVPRKYDGKVDLNDLSRLDYICEADENIHLYSQVLWHVSLKRRIRCAATILFNCNLQASSTQLAFIGEIYLHVRPRPNFD
jgi:hypothetical protein